MDEKNEEENKKEDTVYNSEYPEQDGEVIDEDSEDIIDSSLEIGGQIHQQSQIVQKFVQLPRDVKYSKFGAIDLANFTLKSKTYQLWNYLKKIQKISKEELSKIKEDKREIYDIETLEDLKQHFEDTKKTHIWYNLIQNLTPVQLEIEFVDLKKQLHSAKDEGVLEYIYGDKEHFYDSYNDYLENNTSSDEVDDFGLMASMMTLTEIKKAHQGWGTKMMNTTINVTKDEDIDEDTEEAPEKKESFIAKLKNKMDISAEQIIKYTIIAGGFAVCGVAFWTYNKFLLVKQSVGWNFIQSIGYVRRGTKGYDLVLEIVSQSGKRTFKSVAHSPIINYEHMEKGELVKKGVIYDERAVERINGIPVLKCTPVDIRPIDRETGLLVNIPSELIDKLAVDSSKSAENEAKHDKERKMLIYGLIGMCLLFVVALSYINQTNAELQVQLASATINAAKSATIIAG